MDPLPEPSVRPKVRSGKQHKKYGFEALDKKMVKFEDQDGVIRHFPALHPQFCHAMVYPLYSPPLIELFNKKSFDIKNIDDHPEIRKWFEKVTMLAQAFDYLLKLTHHHFWSTIVYDNNVSHALDSYLKNAPRFGQLHDQFVSEQMKTAIRKLHTSVFTVLFRMSSAKESDEFFISPTEFSKIITENGLFDISKLVNIAVVYGVNDKLLPYVRMIFDNIFFHVPQNSQDLVKCCCEIVDTMKMIEHKLLFEDDFLKSDLKKRLEAMRWPELQYLIGMTADVAICLRMLVKVYSPAAQIYHTENVDSSIVEFYGNVFVPVIKELNVRFEDDENAELLEDKIKQQICNARSNLIESFREVIKVCFLEQICDDKLSTSTKTCLFDDFLALISFAASEKSFITDYFKKYNFEEDLEILKIRISTKDFDNNIIAIRKLISDNLISKDKIKIKENQADEKHCTGVINNNEAVLIEEVEITSKIQYIVELIPDLGEGFVEKCLEYYKFDNELVIAALLEDSLAPELKSLDRKLPRPCKKDKIEFENNSLHLEEVNQIKVPEVIKNRKNVYDGDEFDIFRNKNVDLRKIHKGKKKKDVVAALDETAKEKIKFLSEKIAEEEAEAEIEAVFNSAEYDDEYDDTYEDDTIKVDLISDKLIDELNVGEKESLSTEMNQPNSTQTYVTSSNSKWNSNSRYSNRNSNKRW